MLAIWASAAILVAASLIAGRALLVAFGWREWSWLSGPVGLAGLVVLAQPLIRLPGRGVTAAIALAALLIGSVALLRGRWSGEPVRRVLVRDGVAVGIVVLAASSLPFLFSERTGVLGEGVYTNDQAAQLYWTEWLKEGLGPEPAGVELGYPLGPQSLVAALSAGTGISPEDAYNGLLLAIPVLTALATLAVLAALPAGRRVIAAALVGLPYLAASFLAQSGFKETAMALFLLAFVLALREIDRREVPARAAVAALAALAAGSVFAYSLPGLLWPGAALVAWLASGLATGRLALPRAGAGRMLLMALPVAGVAAVILVVFALTLGSLGDFLDRLGDVQNTGGRLISPVSPREVLGVWPDGDFRADVADEPAAILATLIGLAAAGLAAWWWWVRRDLAVPAALAGTAVVYVLTRWKGGIHVEAKALAIASPLVTLLVTRALLDPRRWPGARGTWSRIAPVAVPAVAVAFVVGATLSTLAALREAPVGTTPRTADLETLRPIVQGNRVLYLVPDRFSSYRLRGARVGSPGGYVPSQDVPARRAKRWDQGLPLDLDTVDTERMDQFRFAITTSAAFQSTRQKNWVPTHVTPSYTLWRRFEAAPPHGVLDDEHGNPGAVLDCTAAAGRRLAGRGGTAGVTPEPVVRPPAAWEPDSEFETGDDATVRLTLSPGTWDLSLQYHSPVDLELEGGGLDEQLPASLDGMFAFAPGEGPFWPAGSVEVDETGPVELTVRQQELSWLQRLAGVERTTWLGAIAASRPLEPEHPVPEEAEEPPQGAARQIPLEDACGRYVDWFRSS
jgi:hypothetical protein